MVIRVRVTDITGADGMKLVCISDTHSLHRRIPDIPDGDVLIHAGDSLVSLNKSPLTY